MIRARLEDVKADFFRRVERGMDSAQTIAMNRSGTILRRAARRLINKKAKKVTRVYVDGNGQVRDASYFVGAPAGDPPRKRKGTIRSLLVYARDKAKASIVVGPTLAESPTGAPEVMEAGGKVTLPDRGPGGGRKFDALGRLRFRDVTLRPRPYMSRSLSENLDKMPEQWRDTLKG